MQDDMTPKQAADDIARSLGESPNTEDFKTKEPEKKVSDTPTAAELEEEFEEKKKLVFQKFFGSDDPDKVSKRKLVEILITQVAQIGMYQQSLDVIMCELYCENPKHAVFNTQPPATIEQFEKTRQSRNAGRIVIPKLVIGGRR